MIILRNKHFSESPDQRRDRRVAMSTMGGILATTSAAGGYISGKRKIDRLSKSKTILEKSIEKEKNVIEEGWKNLSKDPKNHKIVSKISNSRKALDAKEKGLKILNKTLKKTSPKKRAAIGAAIGLGATIGANEILKKKTK